LPDLWRRQMLLYYYYYYTELIDTHFRNLPNIRIWHNSLSDSYSCQSVQVVNTRLLLQRQPAKRFVFRCTRLELQRAFLKNRNVLR